MQAQILLPAATAILALVFAVALLDQWLERRRPFQLVWAAGMLFYGLAAGCEAIGGASGWNEGLYRIWYLTGAAWTAGWLGLGTAFLLGRTRFGYAFAFSLLLAGLFTFLTQRRYDYPDSDGYALVYFITAGILALAIGVETYFQNEHWPRLAGLAVIGATVLSVVLMAGTTLAPPGYALDAVTGVPVATLLPGSLRLLTPFLNVTGAFSLLLGALFSTYVFMPKRRVLAYSLEPDQKFDSFLFNLLISPVAITVNFLASLPATWTAFRRHQLHSRVPATILIALGAFFPSVTSALGRFDVTTAHQLGNFVGVLLMFAGFAISTETFRQVRIPFTRLVLWSSRPESATGTEGGDGI